MKLKCLNFPAIRRLSDRRNNVDFRSAKEAFGCHVRGGRGDYRQRAGYPELLENRVVLDSTIVFNEIMYNSAGSDESAEWIELHNQMAIDMDISGWRIDGGVRFDFPRETIVPGGGYLVVAKDPDAIQSTTELSEVLGPFAGSLSNAGEELRLWNNFNSFITRRQLIEPVKYWSVDLQDAHSPQTKSGADASLQIGRFWNRLDVDVHPGVGTNPSINNLRDSSGNQTDVGFSIRGTVTGFSDGENPLLDDSIFVRAGNADPSVDWRISALVPAATYQLYAFGGNVPYRKTGLTIDMDGDGDLTDETSTQVAMQGFHFENITADTNGIIRGEFSAGNWAGFHLIEGHLADPLTPATTIQAGNSGRRLMDSVDYDDNVPWPVASDGGGVSLAKSNQDSASREAANWVASAQVGGTPGSRNLVPRHEPSPHLTGLMINEVASSADERFRLEIVNASATAIDLKGMVLASSEAPAPEYMFSSQSLRPGEIIVLNETTIGFHPTDNERLFLYSPNKMFMVDAVRVDNAPRARWPNGDGRWLVPEQPTFGLPNQIMIEDTIVINEIMYHPFPIRSSTDLFAANPEEWIELYNRSATETVDLTGWTLTGGIDYVFPDRTFIGPDEYLVIAKDSKAFGAEYPGVAVVGDFRGILSNRGDVIRLNDALGNPADEVRYYDGGRWPQFADGGGSSLELRDPHADNSKPEAWASSDETAKSSWRRYEYQGVATADGVGIDTWNEFIAGLLEAGEILLDDVSVVENPNSASAVELIQNGDFQNDALKNTPVAWRMPGNHGLHGRSVVVEDPHDATNRSLHVVASGPTKDLSNHLETTLVRENVRQLFEPHRVWSVDLQGGRGSSNNMFGADDFVKVGFRWNHADVPVMPGTALDMALVDLRNSAGDATDVRFTIDGTVGGFLRGRDPLVDDSIFVRAGKADPSVEWRISELVPEATYQLYAFGGNVPFRKAELTIDMDGDGDLTDETSTKVAEKGFHFENIMADANGVILGDFSSGNWAGFHLIAGEVQSPLLPPEVEGAIVTAGREYRVSFRAKWLGGSNQLNTRLYFNWLQKTTLLEVPTNNGTPGHSNSRRLDNAGPTYDNFFHSPVIPRENQDVTVSVVADDHNGVDSLTLWYRVGTSAWSSAPMDESPAGTHVGVMPGQVAGSIVQFYVEGQDARGTTSFYPATGPDSRASFKVEDGLADLSRKHNVRIVMTAPDTEMLYRDTNRMSNHRIGATVIYDEKTVFYDVGIRLKGSPHGRQVRDDVLAGLNIQFHPDHLFRGVHRTISINRGEPQEMIAYQFYNHAAGGLVNYYHDLGHVIMPRSEESGGAVLAMARQTDVFLDSQFENGGQGMLFDLRLLFPPTTTVTGNPESEKLNWPPGGGLAQAVNTDIRDLGDDKETYRWFFEVRNNRGKDDFTQLIQLAKAFELTGDELAERMRDIMDVDQWLRTFAMQALAGVHDDYPGVAGHNFRIYQRPRDNKMVALPPDLDHSFVEATDDKLWLAGIRAAKLIEWPTNTRVFYGHLWDIINTSFNTDYMARWTEHFQSLGGPDYAGRTNYGETTLKYIAERSSFAVMQLPDHIDFQILTIAGVDFPSNERVVTLQGSGWIDVREVRLAGSAIPLPLVWQDDQTWEIMVPLPKGTNRLELQAFGHQGQKVGADAVTITAGDFDGDQMIGARDIDLLFSEINDGAQSARFDLTFDTVIDQRDVDELVLNVLGTRYGDTDLDGDVDQADFETLAKNFGSLHDRGNPTWSIGDFDGDGKVTFRDFNLLAIDFGFENT